VNTHHPKEQTPVVCPLCAIKKTRELPEICKDFHGHLQIHEFRLQNKVKYKKI